MGIRYRLQRFVSGVGWMLYGTLPIGVLVDDGGQDLGQMIPVTRKRFLRIKRFPFASLECRRLSPLPLLDRFFNFGKNESIIYFVAMGFLLPILFYSVVIFPISYTS